MRMTLNPRGVSTVTGLAVMLTLLSAAVCPADRPAAVRVFVSVAPLATFVQRVGGIRVEVQTLVRPGHNPHLYEPTARQIAALADADLFIRTGVPFEAAWMDRIRSVNADMPVLDVRDGIALRMDDGHPDPHGSAHLDPHVWTSPPLAQHMARLIRDALVDLDPEHRETYAAGFAAWARELDALDREIRDRLAVLDNRRFMVYHPAWGYFADTYGLTQIPVEHEGKEPGPRRIKELIDLARRDGIKFIMVQPQFSGKTAATIAQAIEGRIVTADPMAIDYADNMRRVTRLIVDNNAS